LVAKTLRETSYSYNTYDWLYEPTGILSLEISEYISENIKLKFADSKSIILEDQLIDFIDTVFEVAEIKKRDTEKREKENKEYEVKRRINAYNQLCMKYEIEQIQSLEEEINNFEME
jgi:hypothetical protein